jgi:Flp pilus assembly CpaF family ATPase
MTLASGFEPVDPTGGELSPEERRGLVRRIADVVGSKVSAKVQAALEAGRALSEAAEKVASSTEIQQALRVENESRLRAGLIPFTESTHVALHDAVLAHIYGLGELEELWHHPAVEEIDANGPFDVFATFVGGVKKPWSAIASSRDEFVEVIRRAARRMGFAEVEFDARHPLLDLQLADGSRLYAVFGGRGTNGVGVETYLCIRRHRFMKPTPADFVDLGVWPEEAGAFVVAAFGAGENVIVAGDHFSGKTTLLRGLCLAAIQPWERTVTVEAAITELGLHTSGRLPNCVALYSRPPGAEGEGAVSVAELIKGPTRRLNPTRVLVGEVLGDEVGPVLDVFTSSTRGSGCTIHARSARAVIRRFEQYGLASRPPLPPESIRYALGEAEPIIVHLTGDESVEGELHRYCTSIVEVTGLEDGHVSATELWGLDDSGRLVPKHALSAAKRERLARRGWDWSVDGWAHRLPDGVLS